MLTLLDKLLFLGAVLVYQKWVVNFHLIDSFEWTGIFDMQSLTLVHYHAHT